MENSLARLRERRAALGAPKAVTRAVPGYEGDLAVRYKWVAYEVMAAKGQALAKVKDPTRRDILAAQDTLVALCQEVVVKPDDPADPRIGEDGYVPLAAEGEAPVTFGDDRIAHALGFEPGTARENAARTVCNDYAVLAEAVALSAWLQDTSREVDSEFQGS